ncbi:MAG: right-handed parallel beta-helix repeat-containing protein [Bacteroidales bacterium]
MVNLPIFNHLICKFFQMIDMFLSSSLKRILLLVILLLIALGMFYFCNAQQKVLQELKNEGFLINKVRTAGNIQELITALENNTVIYLEPGEYIFPEPIHVNRTPGYQPGKFDTLSNFFDDIAIHDIKNLAIIGPKDSMALIVQPDYGKYVLYFRKTENLFLQNLVLDHQVKNGCMAGVIKVENSRNVIMDNLELRGSGYEGVFLDTVKGYRLKNSVITECSGQLSTFFEARDVRIDSCIYTGNQADLRGFTIENSEITFKNSVIESIFPFQKEADSYKGAFNVFLLMDHKNYFEPDEPYLLNTRVRFNNTVINDEIVNHEYKNIQYVYPHDPFGPPLIKFKDLIVYIHDLQYGFYYEEPDYYSDTVNIHMDIGIIPDSSLLEIIDSELKKIEKVEQQYETSLAIAPVYGYTELPGWKHYVSPWRKLSMEKPGQYRLLSYSMEELSKFPEFEEEELIQYLESQEYHEYAELIRNPKEGYGKHWYVAPSRISLRIIGMDRDNNKVTRFIHFWIPMGD